MNKQNNVSEEVYNFVVKELEENAKLENFKFRIGQLKALYMMLKYTYGIVYATCALGKTYIEAAYAYYTFKNATNYKTVVLISPRLLLNQQLYADFLELYDFESIGVTIRNLSSDKAFDGQTTINPLKALLENQTSHLLIITTPASLKLYKDNFWNCFSEEHKIDCILWDEAHKEANKELRDNCQKYAHHAYFLSATPDEKLLTYPNFGCFQYTYVEAIKDGVAVDFETYIMETDKTLIGHKDIAAYHYATIKKAFFHNKTIKPNEPSVILACETCVEYSDKIAEKIINDPELKDVDVYLVVSPKKQSNVSGPKFNNIPMSKKNIVNEIHGTLDKDSIIIHVAMIQEGISCNSINGVVILGNKTDENMYQTVMRGARLNKKYNKTNFRIYYSIGEDTEEKDFLTFVKKLYNIYPNCKFHFGLDKDKKTGGKNISAGFNLTISNKLIKVAEHKMKTEWKPNYNALRLEKEIRMRLIDEEPINICIDYLSKIDELTEAGMTTNDVVEICGLT